MSSVAPVDSLHDPSPGSGRLLPCEEADSDLYFSERPADLALAKEACQECPLRRPCLEAALERGEPWGVWGGEILVDGQVVAVKRGRGRPRKDRAA
jgi:WhiB family transcriptional regulator, redox-sensing transcriptional regulator